MKNIIILFVFLLNFNCNFFEPSYILINNNSKYDIKISADNANIKQVIIYKNDSDFILCYPGDIKLEISIDEIKFKIDYQIHIGYMEKKELNFELNI